MRPVWSTYQVPGQLGLHNRETWQSIHPSIQIEQRASGPSSDSLRRPGEGLLCDSAAQTGEALILGATACCPMLMTPHLPQSPLTPKVGSISEASVPGAPCQHTEQPVLDEVHLPAHGALTHHQVPRLEDLKAELGEHCSDEAGVSVGKQRHVGHQAPAGEVNNLLDTGGAYQAGFAPCRKMPPPSSSVSRNPIHPVKIGQWAGRLRQE